MEIFESLIAGADALVENFSPRVMEGFGISWEKVQALNPRCHYVRMPAFGLDGPMARARRLRCDDGADVRSWPG